MHSTIGSIVHSRPLNSLEHCTCTTTMANIRPDWDSNLVPPDYNSQSIRMSHRGRPIGLGLDSDQEYIKLDNMHSFLTISRPKRKGMR